MKYIYALFLVLIPGFALAQTLAWFTDAPIPGGVKCVKPADAQPDAPGTYGNGVLLTKAVAMDANNLQQASGLISFWIKPNWNGNDAQTHKLLSVGNPTTNGLLVEKSSQNTLRYVMAGGGKVTVSRSDVSGWKSGEWHHIAISWFQNNGNCSGIPLWIDHVAVDGPIYGGTSFMNPATMTDKRVLIGDINSNAVMDELICTSNSDINQITVIYPYYFLTAPYTAIMVDPEPNLTKSDKRVVNGAMKQFGVRALKEGKWERITDFDVRYGQWSDFDAKPYIAWTSSDASTASVNSNGRVFGNKIGHATITAVFRSMRASYDASVISPEQPDLDLLYVERTPRYSRREAKIWPTEGELVHSIVHVGNFGYTAVPAGAVVKFERIPDTNRNFVLDDTEQPIDTRTTTLSQPLAPGATTSVTFDWNWTQDPIWIRVTLDPDNNISEICEANNERCELNTGRAFHWGRNDQKFQSDYQTRQITHVGSFSDYDWCNGEIDRCNIMLRETVLPTTSPDGVKDMLRSDNFMSRTYGPWEEEPWETERHYYDGGYPDMEPQNDTLMDMDPPIIHEIGHVCLTLPDFYGQGTMTYNMFLKDQNGQNYANTPLWPQVTWYGAAPFPSSMNMPCFVGYANLMVTNHLWLHPTSAGITNYYGGTRMDLTAMNWTPLVPKENQLKVYDANDLPLKGAAIYVYQCVQVFLPNGDLKYIPDRPKFIGNTDDNGMWVFPHTTSASWDDWTTDQVDGAVSVWNPFKISDHDFVDPSWVGGDEFVVKIVSGDKVELQWLPLTEFFREFFCGRGTTAAPATYELRTSLNSVPGGTIAVPPTIPDAIKVINQKPVAVVPTEVYCMPGETFTIDGSHSYDPEGQPLTYRWYKRGVSTDPNFADTPILTGTMSISNPADSEYWFYVMDGLRMSDVITVTVKLGQSSKVSGRVTDATGLPIASAIVGIKKSAYATADALQYFTTDSNGTYTTPVLENGTYYVAAWKDGWVPSIDKRVDLASNPATADIQLSDLVGKNLVLNSTKVAASNTASTYTPVSAVDGDLTTKWRTDNWPPEPVSYYIDLGAPTDIVDITLYRYLEINQWGGTNDNYQIDVMTNGNPLSTGSWNENPYVSTVYSAQRTLHGYPIMSDVAVDPIGLNLSGIRGIRITCSGILWPAFYELREVAVHASSACSRIGDFKGLGTGTSGKIIRKQVTAKPGGAVPDATYYIEDNERSTGIRINTMKVTGVSIDTGDTIDVAGALKVAPSGEKYLSATSVVKQTQSPFPAIKPVGMNSFAAVNKANQGMLVTVWGKVKTIGTNYFIISDGGKSTVKVTSGPLVKPGKDKFVRVIGIVSADTSGSVVMLRKQPDWTEISN